jgi:hypothetical protein
MDSRMGMREYDEPVKAVRRDLSPRPLRPRPAFQRNRLLAAALAASLLVALGTLYQKSRIQNLAEPRIVSSVVALFPEGAALRGAEESTNRLLADTQATLILVSDAEPEAFPSHEVLIVDSDGSIRFRVVAGRRGPDGALNMFLPAGLPEGNYRIQVSGIEGGRKKTLESYPVFVRSHKP